MVQHKVLLMLLLIFIVMLAEENALYVCEGDSVILFPNTTFNAVDELHLTLYRDNDVIEYWTRNTPVDKIRKGNRVERNKNNDIWLYNVSTKDQGHYYLLYSRITKAPRKVEMDGNLLISVPGCKPAIQSVENGHMYNLSATLLKLGCGMLVDALIWTLPGNINLKNTPMFRVNSTEKPGLYKVCIGGSDMKCVNGTDHCDEFYVNKSEAYDTEESNTSGHNKSVENSHTDIGIMIALITAGLCVIQLVILVWYRMRKQSRKQAPPEETQKLLDQSEENKHQTKYYYKYHGDFWDAYSYICKKVPHTKKVIELIY